MLLENILFLWRLHQCRTSLYPPPFLNICIIKTISLTILKSRIPHGKPHQLQSKVVRSMTRHRYQSDLGCCSQESNTQPYTYVANIHKYMHRHDMDEILLLRHKTTIRASITISWGDGHSYYQLSLRKDETVAP